MPPSSIPWCGGVVSLLDSAPLTCVPPLPLPHSPPCSARSPHGHPQCTCHCRVRVGAGASSPRAHGPAVCAWPHRPPHPPLHCSHSHPRTHSSCKTLGTRAYPSPWPPLFVSLFVIDVCVCVCDGCGCVCPLAVGPPPARSPLGARCPPLCPSNRIPLPQQSPLSPLPSLGRPPLPPTPMRSHICCSLCESPPYPTPHCQAM